MDLSYKDICFILEGLNLLQQHHLTNKDSLNEDIASDAGNDYLFTQSLIKKLEDNINDSRRLTKGNY
jgi:hypothetical protein